MLSAARFSNLTQLKRVVIPISPYNKSSRNKAYFTIELSRNHNDVTKLSGSCLVFLILCPQSWLPSEAGSSCGHRVAADRNQYCMFFFRTVTSRIFLQCHNIPTPQESSGKFFIQSHCPELASDPPILEPITHPMGSGGSGPQPAGLEYNEERNFQVTTTVFTTDQEVFCLTRFTAIQQLFYRASYLSNGDSLQFFKANNFLKYI